MILKIPARSWLVSAWVIFFGLFTSLVIVHADDVSTSVTVGNSAPSISSLSLNYGSDITLTENTATYATTTMTVTDTNGCSEISSVTAKLYRSDTSTEGTICSVDDANCYTSFGSCTATTTGDSCTGGADTSVEYECVFKLWYVADPTDSGAYASDIWVVSATTTDGSNTSTATNTAQTIEVNTLNSLDVTSSIAYGSVSPNSNTGATTQTTTVTNTGNAAIDSEISGDVMCTDYSTCDGGVMQPSQQKYGLSDVTYGSLTYTLSATSSPDTRELDLAKPSATTSAVTDDVYWGIAVPSGQTPGSYTGQNTFGAVAD